MAGKPDPKKVDPKAAAAAKGAPAKGAENAENPDIEQVLFQGPMFGREANLKAHARLVQAALVPVKQMISDALTRRAHTIILEPREGRVSVRYSIDGMPYPAGVIPGPKGMAMIQVVKLLAGLNPEDRQTATFGGIKAEFDKIGWNLMVDTTPVGGGAEKLRVKIENRKVVRQRPADVGMPEAMKMKIRNMTADRAGVVLVCGPPDSGVTTLSIVALHCVDPYLYQVFNMADLKGRELINVTDFKPEPGHDLEISFDRIIRREADVMFMNPLNPHDAQVIFQYADRLAFIVEIPASTPFEAVKKVIEWVGVDAVLKGLRAVLTQKLIRKLCDDCKQAFRLNPLLLKKLGLPPETTVLYRAPSPPPADDPKAPTIEELCGPCAGVPYHGRAADFELLEISDGMKEVIATKFTPEAVRSQMAAEGQTTLQKDAIRLVADGKTSLEEVQRVFSSGAPAKKPAKAQPRPPGAPPRG